MDNVVELFPKEKSTVIVFSSTTNKMSFTVTFSKREIEALIVQLSEALEEQEHG